MQPSVKALDAPVLRRPRLDVDQIDLAFCRPPGMRRGILWQAPITAAFSSVKKGSARDFASQMVQDVTYTSSRARPLPLLSGPAR